jgi:polyhydroxybutyrate depolymerase
MSKGGMMSYRLGCELSSRIAAIAPVAGNMAAKDGSAQDVGCMPARPVSVLAIHGTLDPYAPYAGGIRL